jgi:hypothetical protein
MTTNFLIVGPMANIDWMIKFFQAAHKLFFGHTKKIQSSCMTTEIFWSPNLMIGKLKSWLLI